MHCAHNPAACSALLARSPRPAGGRPGPGARLRGAPAGAIDRAVEPAVCGVRLRAGWQPATPRGGHRRAWGRRCGSLGDFERAERQLRAAVRRAGHLSDQGVARRVRTGLARGDSQRRRLHGSRRRDADARFASGRGAWRDGHDATPCVARSSGPFDRLRAGPFDKLRAGGRARAGWRGQGWFPAARRCHQCDRRAVNRGVVK